MGTRIRFEFVDEGVSAVAELDEISAPRSCAAVLAALPQEGDAHHATYSGSEVAFVLDRDLHIGLENATSKVIPGDLAYTRFEGGVMFGVPESFSELAWFYDRDATPSMADGPVPMNIIGTFVEGFAEFAQVCRVMRRSGVKHVKITVEE
ncbi:MAG: DUF3830 family protein [Thermomicrobiales bacterium]|nr:DUF3830 family protein [Thermomicrobiales bacterium]MCO5220732.1 DUF3830 family protein [Thermomicrobiales bacterium]